MHNSWRRNLVYVSVGVVLWLVVTLTAAWPAAQGKITSGQFIWAAQVAPVLYWLIVVVYGVLMNRHSSRSEAPDRSS
jgi:hypothetical protein